MPDTRQDTASVLRGAFDRGLAARRATVGRVFRAVETVLMFEGGQRTARRNAWAAVCADRSRARARAEASDILARLAPVKPAPGAGSR
ncbi:hypothetical protein [Embleya hyalina]|uniref:Uncharacterized protein n=1 Tax=Embleya hyalina TaxID=516124 RepID=A0A401YP39_9ACTN|nr:hypothetical protein [Embleya hyalina]GCD96318.1 hypothetical protein EHYA_04003 [Embleya hyalina]